LIVKTLDEMIEEAKKTIIEISSDQLNNMLLKHVPCVLIDVRLPEENAQGKIAEARNIPRGVLEFRIEDEVPSKDTPIVVYCGGGSRSALAAKTLGEMGYTQVVSLAGGYRGFKSSSNLK